MAEELAKAPKETNPMLRDYFAMRDPFEKKQKELGEQIEKSKGAEITAGQKEKETLVAGEVQGQKLLQEGQAKAQEEYKAKVEKEPLPAFIPTQDTAQDLAGIFSLVSVLGMVAGRGDAQRALGAMNGMLEGYQKGRADVYKKERAVFEANFKSMLKKHEEFRKEMEDAAKLAVSDKEKAMVDAKQAALKYGGDIAKAQVERLGPAGALDRLKDMQKGSEHVFDMVQRQKEAERQRAATIEAARIRSSGAGGALPKDTKTNDEHRFRYGAIENVKDVLADLQNPEIRKLIGPQNQYLPDVILNLQDKYPQLAQKLARFQSQEFQIGGKNLTKTEQGILGPIYNWRGLTAKALEDNLTEADRAMSREQMLLEARYPGLQEIGERYANVGTAPAAPAPASAGQNIQQDAIKRFGKYEPEKYDYGYENGKFYRDEK